MKTLMRITIIAILSFFSLNANAGTAPEMITKEEALAFTKQFIDDGKSLANQHTDLTKEPSPDLKRKFHAFLMPKIAKSTARTILGRAILSEVGKTEGLTAAGYISDFVSQLVGYEVKFYGSHEKMKIFQEATYDEKTAKVDLSPDRTQARVEISFSYDDKTAAVQFFLIKEDGSLKLDDLGLEGISQKSNQTSEIRAYYAAPDKGASQPKTFMSWFTGEINSYLAR